MPYPKPIEAALKYVLDGVENIRPVEYTQGRPSGKQIVNGIILDRYEIDVYNTLIAFWKQARELARSEIMSDEEFVVFMKAAAPMLNKRMIDMALVSDDLKAVRQVAADLADRGYGKSAAQVNINISDKDIRGAWKQIEDRGIIDVTNMIEDKSHESV